jgi:heterogeneous nuclear ribonucleoprotein A1/A3
MAGLMHVNAILHSEPCCSHLLVNTLSCSFITFEDEASVASVFNAGSMQELGGKKVEVKTATPKGSGPIGRGPAGMAATAALGRGITLPAGASRGIMPGRFGEFAYGIGPAGYPMPAGVCV